MSLDDHAFIDDEDRPWGWGCCSLCGEDADDADYDATTRRTTCAACRAKEPRVEFERDLAAYFNGKGL